MDVEHWLRVYHAPQIGPITFRRILEQYGEPGLFLQEQGWRHPQLGLPPACQAYFETAPEARLKQDLAWLTQPDNHCITLHDPAYPNLLQEIADPPPLLYVKGQPDVLQAVQLAIVGARNPSPTGRQTATDFAYELARQGMVITSGLALGIDGAAHQAALDAGGLTIAVMGTGLNRVYPAKHLALAHAIVDQGGAMVSEFPLDSQPRPQFFPRRNRIISGLAVGTLVVEAALNSGSLITARQALEQGREVFAIPGAIHNPLARGCHQIIREGAKLVEQAGHILEELGTLALASQTTNNPVPDKAPGKPALATAKLSQEQSALLDYLTPGQPIAIDWLADKSGYRVAELSSMLLILELEGFVQAIPGGFYTRQ